MSHTPLKLFIERQGSKLRQTEAQTEAWVKWSSQSTRMSLAMPLICQYSSLLSLYEELVLPYWHVLARTGAPICQSLTRISQVDLYKLTAGCSFNYQSSGAV